MESKADRYMRRRYISDAIEDLQVASKRLHRVVLHDDPSRDATAIEVAAELEALAAKLLAGASQEDE